MPLTLDAGGIIERFATGSYSVTRRPSGTFADGIPVLADPVAAFQIRAFVVPATGRVLDRLPEGHQTRETKMVFTATLLLVGGQGAAFEADRVAIDGVEWEVQLVDDWPARIPFYRALVQRPS